MKAQLLTFATFYSLLVPSIAQFFSCEGVPACGVLALESGLGPGYYHHKTPSVHGLWPETGSYGNSKCIAPKDPTDPDTVYGCYSDGNYSHQLDFEKHEWGKHGRCAGVRNAEDYFTQICSISKKPLEVMATKSSFSEMHQALLQAGYPIFKVDSEYSQFYLPACLHQRTGKWIIAAEESFPAICGDHPSPSPKPSNETCRPNQHGPRCRSDSDCVDLSGCVRCAHSGYCTSAPVSSLRQNQKQFSEALE